MTRQLKRRYLRLLGSTLNRLTRRLARNGSGHFSLICHVGRRSGASYQTPVILARTADGFVAELTYGPHVDWYRNIVAAGGCEVIYRGRRFRVDRVDPCATEVGLQAFGNPSRLILKLLRRREFRLLHLAGESLPPQARRASG